MTALALLVLALVLGPWIFVFIHSGRINRLARLLEEMQSQMKLLEGQKSPDQFIQETDESPRQASSPVTDEFWQKPAGPVKEKLSAPLPIVTEKQREEAYGPVYVAPENSSDNDARLNEASAVSAESVSGDEDKRVVTPASPSFEDWFMGKAGVLVGALTLGLGTIFLVRYSIEMGVFGPLFRISGGLLLGALLLSAGEWVRRHPGQYGSGHVPMALSAGGLVAIYGALYAAHGLYELIPAAIAFPALVLTAAGGAALSLLYGPLVAGLSVGLVYAAPALVSSGAPNPLVLFFYLAVAGCGFLLLLRWHPWRWLTWTVTGLTIVWHLAAMVSGLDEGWLEASLALMMQGGFSLWWLTRDRPVGLVMGRFGPVEMPEAAWSALTAGISTSMLLGLWLAVEGGGAATGWLWQIAFVGLILLTRRRPELLYMLPLLAAGSVALALIWHLPGSVEPTDMPWFLTGTLVPTSMQQYLMLMIVMALTLAILPGAISFEHRRPARGLWATVAASAPLLVLFAAYVRVTGFDVSLPFVFVGLLAAGAYLLAAERMARRGFGTAQTAGETAALAAYAAAVVCALSLAAAMGLRNGLLTVAFALPLPVLGLIWRRLTVPGLGELAALLAGAVLLRLILNKAIFSYGLGVWLLVLCLVCAALLLVAAHVFRPLEKIGRGLWSGGIALLGYFLILLGLRLETGDFDVTQIGLLTLGLSVNGWLLMSWVQREMGHHTLGEVLLVGALFMLVPGAVIVFNPLLTGDPVGKLTVINVMLIAYLLPACLLLLVMRGQTGTRPSLIRGLSFLLVFGWLTLNVRHWFSGTDLTRTSMRDNELYVYSLIWLLFSVLSVCAGLWRDNRPLVRAGLALMSLVVLKVFLIDMSALDGLLRALSFIGLGGALIGIGFAYQRLVGRRV